MLENIERKIEDDIDEFNSKRKSGSTHPERGIKVTKKLLLESS
jgi:hypothetical protein